MSQYYLIQDLKRCIGCLSCEVHCKSNKGLPPGPRLGQIITVGPKLIENRPQMAFVFMPCFHCTEPWCVSVCPTGAMRIRHKDQIVYVDQSLCVGCKSCISACPWGAPQWHPKIGKVVKCDYCMDRVDQGLEPACVTKCVTHCLKFGEIEKMEPDRRQKFAEKVAFELITVVSAR